MSDINDSADAAREGARHNDSGQFGVQVHAESGVVEVNDNKLSFCAGCGRPEGVCTRNPCDGVLEDRGETRAPDDEDHCTGCGRIDFECSADPCDGVLEDRGETRCLYCGRPQPDCDADPCGYGPKPVPERTGLARFEAESTTWTIRDVQGLTFGMDEYGDVQESLEMGSPYRVAKTWDETKRRAFIGALLQGLPMAPVVINDRVEADWDDPTVSEPGLRSPGYGVIDGEQRLRVLHDFSISELSVPATWFPIHMIGRTEIVDGETHVCCADLLYDPKEMLKLPVSKMSLNSRAEEAAVRSQLDPAGMPVEDAAA